MRGDLYFPSILFRFTEAMLFFLYSLKRKYQENRKEKRKIVGRSMNLSLS